MGPQDDTTAPQADPNAPAAPVADDQGGMGTPAPEPAPAPEATPQPEVGGEAPAEAPAAQPEQGGDTTGGAPTGV